MNTALLGLRNDKTVRNAWADWMDQYKWNWFFTITYKTPRNSIDTLKGGRWLHKTAGADRSALFIEPYQKWDGLHLHGLTYFREGVAPARDAMERLEERLNTQFGESRVLPAWEGRASRYVTKYTGLIGMDDLDFDLLGDWENPMAGNS